MSRWPRSRDDALSWPDGCGIYQRPLYPAETDIHRKLRDTTRLFLSRRNNSWIEIDVLAEGRRGEAGWTRPRFPEECRRPEVP